MVGVEGNGGQRDIGAAPGQPRAGLGGHGDVDPKHGVLGVGVARLGTAAQVEVAGGWGCEGWLRHGD